MARKKKKLRCVYVDRDGVLNQGGNIGRASELRLILGVAAAILKLKKAGFLVIVVTNQGGLGENIDGTIRWKGHPLTREELAAIHAELVRQLGDGAAPDAIKICPHSVSVKCKCRKPKPDMLLEAAAEYEIDLAGSYMVGDRATDVEAGIAAGVTPILVLSGPDGAATKEKDAVPAGTVILPSLVEAAEFILSRPRPRRRRRK